MLSRRYLPTGLQILRTMTSKKWTVVRTIVELRRYTISRTITWTHSIFHMRTCGNHNCWVSLLLAINCILPSDQIDILRLLTMRVMMNSHTKNLMNHSVAPHIRQGLTCIPQPTPSPYPSFLLQHIQQTVEYFRALESSSRLGMISKHDRI
ncbi:hypothetical protein BYT27DRAFT_6433238 [Phlegmacium glaucopus]|nr:hypothetical protein BYT27DRAFT_6433238 [Phlegmacium glaucopus]